MHLDGGIQDTVYAYTLHRKDSEFKTTHIFLS